MGGKLRKFVIGSLAALTLGPCAYVTCGGFYGIYRLTHYQKQKGDGYFNRKKDTMFYNEIFYEKDVLEDRLRGAMKNNKKVDYTLDIVVSEEVKRFFDDKEDYGDNDDWVDYVAESVEFLNEYNRAGIGFKIGKIEIISKEKMVKEIYGPKMCLINSSKKMVMYFTPHTRMKEFDGGRLEAIAAFAYTELGLMYIGISKNKHRNAILTLHETGHVLGLNHVPSNEYKRMFLDPFCIFYLNSFMVPNVDDCSQLKLKDSEMKQLREEHVD
jgi:hypothetical protein